MSFEDFPFNPVNWYLSFLTLESGGHCTVNATKYIASTLVENTEGEQVNNTD